MSLDNVSLYINDNLISDIKSYTLKYDLFQGSATFDAEINRDYTIPLSTSPVSVMWNINGRNVLKGFVERVERSYTKGSHSLNISGRDMTQVLIDNYLLKFETLDGASIKHIIDTILKDSFSVKTVENLKKQPNGKYKLVKNNLQTELFLPKINLVYTTQALDIISKIGPMKKIRKSMGQTIFDFISSMINGAGLAMYNIPGTDNILIHSLVQPDTHITSYSILGNPSKREFKFKSNAIRSLEGLQSSNVISCSFTNDITNYYKLTRLYGMCDSEGDYNEYGTWGIAPNNLKIDKIESDDPKSGYTGVTKFKVIQTQAVYTEMWLNQRPLLINNEILQQNRKLFNFKYTVAGHSPDKGGVPYFFNVLADVDDDYAPFYGKLMTYGVEFKGSKEDGQTTTLELCLPGSINDAVKTYTNLKAGEK